MNITIDPTFESLIPPLPEEERQQLEQNIIAHGCRDALVTWRGLLLDGHNRFEICTRLGIPFTTIEVDLPERDAAEDWMDANQNFLTWAKDRMGTGDWLRGQTEHCLMCVKGKPVVTLTSQTTLLHGPLREHSRKPDEFYALVESLCPASRKCELFSRRTAGLGEFRRGNREV